MGAASFSGDAGGVQQGLDSFEEFRLDQGLMAAGVLDAVVGDDAEVVPVPQEGPQFGVGDGSSGVATGTCAQAAGGQFVDEVFQAVVAGGVQLEGQA